MKKYIFNIDKTMKKYIFVLVASVMAITATAQSLTPQEEREFYQKAYDIMVNYEESATLDNDKKRYTFQRLFKDTHMQICNDLMGLETRQPTLSVYRYVQELKKARSVKVVLKNLRKGGITPNDSGWQMNILFDKAISLTNRAYTYFDSNEFFKDDYHLIATISLDKVTGDCHIIALKCDGAWPKFPPDYRVLQMKEGDKRDRNLYINNKERVVFNSYGQYLLRPEDKVYYNRGPVDLLRLDGEEDVKVQADYKDKSWRIRGYYGLSPFTFYQLGNKSGLFNSDDPDDSEMSIGIDVGYVLRSGSKLHTGLFAGLGLSISKLGLNTVGAIRDSINIAEDDDGDSYNRFYELWDANKGIKQTLKATELVIPVYTDFEYAFTSLFSAYADLGLKFQLTSSKYEDMETSIGTYETWGVYSDYGGLTIRNFDENHHQVEHPVDLNQFGEHETIDVDDKGIKSSLSVDAMFGIGVRLNLNKTFAIDGGAQVVYGLTKGRKIDGSTQIFSYDETKKVDKVNLLRKTESIKHGALPRFILSLIYKF